MKIMKYLNLNEKPAFSFESALDFMGGKWVQGACSDRTFYVLRGTLLQWRTLAQTLWIYSNISPINPGKLTSAF